MSNIKFRTASQNQFDQATKDPFTFYMVNQSYVPIGDSSWTTATDEQIVNMVAAADRGEIDLTDYWNVGDERVVSLSAMDAIGVSESHVAETVTFVLMDKNNTNYKYVTAPTSGETSSRFIIGLKNGLVEMGYMNSSNTNVGGWNGCARRTWCNNVFYNAIPSTFRSIFKQVKVLAMGNSQDVYTSNDYFFLAAEKEVFGSNTYSHSLEADYLTQWEYYKTASNRVKKQGDNGSAYHWWERSACSSYSSYSDNFCLVNSNGNVNSGTPSNDFLISPAGCI